MSPLRRFGLTVVLSSIYLLSCSKTPDGTDADGDGFLLAVDDCDDNEAGVHPGAEEHCDGVDEDCDGEVDNSPIDRVEAWADGDGDGHGDVDAAPELVCEILDGMAASNDDCDDADDTRYPGAEEDCQTGIDSNCDGSVLEMDEDLDGVAACTDCDDRDPLVFPDAEEVCNGVDDDCDGEVDADATDAPRYYLDLDDDGFGDSNTYIEVCDDPPRGYVTERGDCDDTRHDVGGPTTWYRDLDGDGYGDPLATRVLCDKPDGYVEVALDCDDNRESVHPGAAEEPGSGLDSDCSGDYDCFVDGDDDGYGDAVASSADPACADPGLTDEGGDCDDKDADVSPDAVELPADLLDSDCDTFEICPQDFDGDGHGNPGALVSSADLFCTGSGEAVVADDCNDTLATTYPGATETVNDGVDTDCSGGESCLADADADGHADAAGTKVESADLDCTDAGETIDTRSDDCDDTDAEIYASAPELVGNDVDEDCDGELTCYLDDDGDGYGQDDPSTWRETKDSDCTGFKNAEVGDDCDDTSDEASPAVTTERCDGLDNDCDGWADDEDPDDLPADARSYYVDADGDGYGSAGSAAAGMACEAPPSYSFDATDCGDAAATTHVGATEIVANGVDDDCDTEELCYEDLDGDDYGSTSTVESPNLSCTDGGKESELSTDCNDSKSSIYPGAAEVTGDNTDQDCDTHDQCGYDADADGFGSTTLIPSVGKTCATSANEAKNTTDCLDTDASYYPGATEVVADGLDQSCDGTDVCYLDSDEDGYGTAIGTTTPSGDIDCADPGESKVHDDCNDSVSSIYVGAAEVVGDAIDQSCDGHDLCAYDEDRDGYGHATVTRTSVTSVCVTSSYESNNQADCLDTDASFYPGATEVVADGIDQSCDGGDRCYYDADLDTYGTAASTIASSDLLCDGAYESADTDDCNDAAATIFPGAAEVLGDSVDQSCDAHDLCAKDEDKDGYGHATATLTSAGATCVTASSEAKNRSDCLDTDASYYPGAAEIIADGIDQSCDGGDLCYRDADLDGAGTTSTSGTYTKTSTDLDCTDSGESAAHDDCDDSKSTVHVGAAEVLGDAVDQDCDTHDLCAVDADEDGYGDAVLTVTSVGATCATASEESNNRLDCVDGDPDYYPGAPEVVADGLDQSCDGGDRCYYDADLDTYGTSSATVASVDLDCADAHESDDTDDCNDALGAIFPGAPEVLGDGTDQSCDGHDLCAKDEDQDTYGDATATVTSVTDRCLTTNKESTNRLDCLDSDAGYYPGAAEVIADGKDQSCDGGDLCYLDDDLDLHGTSSTIGTYTKASTDLDCTDAKESAWNDDCNDAVSTIFTGASEVVGDDIDQSCDGHDLCAVDADKDGYGHATSTVIAIAATCATASFESKNRLDCLDTDASYYPGATEVVADGEDQSCDGGDLCYLDADADGYGTSSMSTRASTDLDCFDLYESLVHDDCDDAKSTVYLGAPEVLGDDVDQDCDTHDLCAFDYDADGYGHADMTVTSVGSTCETIWLEADNNTDCDDKDDKIYPGAGEPVGDEVDSSCDGKEICFYDQDGDTHGTAATSGTTTIASSDVDCRDQHEARTRDDCDDTAGTVYPGADEAIGDGVDQDCDTHDLCAHDGDGDGYGDATLLVVSVAATCAIASEESTNQLDCDDGDRKVYPGAAEVVADGLDQSCDGGDVCWYDFDGDGHGTSATTGTYTIPSADLDCADTQESLVHDDCDDSAASIHIGASEVLGDDIDQTCDAHDLCAYDGDRDGYGDASVTVTSAGSTCATASKEAKNQTDCMDYAASVYPGAPEIVADGVDQSCDGGDACYADGDGDGYGTSTVTLSADRDCADTGESTLSTDCLDSDAATYPDAAEVLGDDLDQSCDGHDLCAADSDKDGYGHPSSVVTSVGATCVTASKEARNTTDCDDGVSTTWPGATESCNHVDDDCDTTVDEDVSGKRYYDADVDGYGVGTTYVCTTETPVSGYTATVNTDCSDSDYYIHPDQLELCDGKDNACVGATWTSADENDTVSTNNGAAWAAVTNTGTSSSPLSVTLGAGTTYFCSGTYYMLVNASHTGLTGIDGKGSASTILDGGDKGTVLSIKPSAAATMTISDLTVQNGKSSTAPGGVVMVGKSATAKLAVTASDVTVTSNEGLNGGGLSIGSYLTFSTGTTSATSITVSSNTASTLGGGIYQDSESSINLHYATLSDNVAPSGGGLYISSGTSTTATLKYTTISGNSATTGNGGGIYNAGSGTSVPGLSISASSSSSASVTRNKADSGSGGGLYNLGTAKATDAVFDKNSASSGGGIYSGGTFTGGTGVVVSANTATGNGAGIYAHGGTFTFGDTSATSTPKVSGNSTTSGDGGGFYVDSAASVTITNAQVTTNFAPKGAGLYLKDANFTCNGTTGTTTPYGIYGNGTSSTTHGGGAYLSWGSGAYALTNVLCDYGDGSTITDNKPAAQDVYSGLASAYFAAGNDVAEDCTSAASLPPICK